LILNIKTPQQIVNDGVVAVAAGYRHSLFLKSDGSLWAMGQNSEGQLGDGTFNTVYTPEQVVHSNVVAIAAGYNHSLFLKSDGSLWAMGENSYGQLGDGTTNDIVASPERIVASDVKVIACGSFHSLFIKSDGSLWGMGFNSDGQLGDGTTENAKSPVQIVSSNVVAVSGGDSHTLFLKSDGSLWGMGFNYSGQLGDGTFNTTNQPEQIVSSNVTAVAAGGAHSLFLKSDGGNPEAALRFVHLLRQKFDKVILLAPFECASAATMVALGANEIQMGPTSYLTAVDSSLKHDLSPVDHHNYLVSVSQDEVMRILRLWKEQKCGGNPLFLQETVRLLKACGDRGGVGSLRSDDITVPGVARDVLRARLTGLAPSTCEALEVACVIGQEFELPVLQGALGIGFEPLLLQLDEAAQARLVAPRARTGSYGFAHDTIREALYEELSTARRVELHCRVADALEGRTVGDFRVNELAYHLYRALPRADPGRVERYARIAGESAMRGFAYEDAAQFYTWALEAQRFRKDVDARDRCEMLLAYAAAVRLSGNLRDSRKAIERAIDIARQNGFADLLLVAARLQGFDAGLERAASDLGANTFKRLRYVVLPLLAPAILAGALFAFTLSLDEFIITLFLIGSHNTLPIYIYTQVKFGITPEVNALAALLLAASLCLIALAFVLPGIVRRALRLVPGRAAG